MSLCTGALFALFVSTPLIDVVSRHAATKARRAILRTWGRSISWSMNLTVTVHGEAPQPPYYMVANHLTWCDVPMLASKLGCTFVAMAEMAGWPMLGFITRRVGTIFINRKDIRETKRVNALIDSAMDAGEGLLVFVESTTSYGDSVLPFRPALLEPAVQRGVPIHYATLYYTGLGGETVDRDLIHWVEDIPFLEHATRLLRAKGCEGHIVFGSETVTAPDRKTLARLAEEAVGAQLPGRT